MNTYRNYNKSAGYRLDLLYILVLVSLFLHTDVEPRVMERGYIILVVFLAAFIGVFNYLWLTPKLLHKYNWSSEKMQYINYTVDCILLFLMSVAFSTPYFIHYFNN